MSFPAKLLPEARLDIVETIAWYNEQQAGLGKRFRSAFTETISLIREQPLLFAGRYRGIRLAPLKKFPYHVYYVWPAGLDYCCIAQWSKSRNLEGKDLIATNHRLAVRVTTIPLLTC